jgi:tetratricopeptide (TPR) repeat protein
LTRSSLLASLAGSLALAASLASSNALAAAPKDAQAEKALLAAMDTDYLETRFDEAEKKLRSALTACGDKGCTPSVKARVYVALGTVLAGGKKQLEDAREMFVEALKLDPAIKPDPDLTSGEITFAYEGARKELKLDAGAGASASSGGLKHTPVKEQRLRTPVPLYVEVDPALRAKVSRVSVSFLSPGASEWESLLLKKVGEGGFGINLPCEDVELEGTLKYHITVTAEGGAILAAVGSRTEPLATDHQEIDRGRAAAFPGLRSPRHVPRDRGEQAVPRRPAV